MAEVRIGRMGSLVVFLLVEQRRGWSLMIFCARATRGLRRPSLDARSRRSISPHPWRGNEQARRIGEGAARCPFCSQSPHDEAVVARCAQ